VLAFYKALTKDKASLEKAKGYLTAGAQEAYDINNDSFGLSTESASVAMARDKLARVLVWEIQYVPDIEAERRRDDRQVTATWSASTKLKHRLCPPCRVTWRSSCGEPECLALRL